MRLYNGVRITNNPAIFSGRPIVNGHRIAVHDIVVHHRIGMLVEELAQGYGLTPEEVVAALSWLRSLSSRLGRPRKGLTSVA
ncbi:MAG: DUF433 domain-containing protein [Chloroflexota bacterium]|nr:MAG: hypothetical protein DLM70_02950 [Chloroflexota bacterium]